MLHNSQQTCELIIHLERVITWRLISYSVPGNFMEDSWSTLGQAFNAAVQASPDNNHSSNVPGSSFITGCNIPYVYLMPLTN